MKRKLRTLAGLVALLGACTVFHAPTLAAQTTTPTLVKDVDEAARGAFTVTVEVNINNFNYIPVKIPTGKRLVIDYISMSGAAQSPDGPIQPIIILQAQNAGSASNLFYFAPQQSSTVPGQFYDAKQTTIYADMLSVGPGFSGFSPSFLGFNVVISGHLVTHL